jgi:glycosyltransferase involved in cell wall biosynthesis
MNILYHFRTRGTGAEAVHIAGIADAFEKLGHSVVFSSPTGVDPRLTAGNSPYRTIVANGKGEDGGARRGRQAHRRLSGSTPRFLDRLHRWCPDTLFEVMELGYNLVAWKNNRRLLNSMPIHMIYERHALFLVATALLARQHKIPLVVEVNELVNDDRVRRQPWLRTLATRVDRAVFRGATLIVVVSTHLKQRIEALGISGEKILVLPNAVNDAFVSLSDGAPVRQRLGLAGKTVIGFIGWFVQWHQLDLLLDVFAQLAASRPALRLALVGEGPLRAALDNQARTLGISERVIFTGPMPHPEIPAAISAMDVCVVPHSNAYRSPIKLFEYMSQGRLVVAPATEPIATVVRHGENGLLFNPGHVESFVKTLALAVDDDKLRRTAGQRARQDVLERHTWRHNAERVLSAVAVG